MDAPRDPPWDTSELPRETGGFRLLRALGRGGMGVVYEAEELVSGRRVALKVLASELAVSGEAFERFRREARIAASVSDANCVFVFGAHQVEGAPAIAMELCAGETLEHRIRSGEPIPIETAVRWTIEILDGLESAHRSGVVHRDVKPSNCFLSADDHIKVGDFGLARSLERDVQLTRSGVFLGSPLYASPEQVRGRTVDLRSDLYSVGSTLYALLTGRSPYAGENLGEVLARILSEPPEPPRALRPDVPRGLEKVVLRAMARDPAKRYATHAEMRAALAPFVERSSEAASPLRRFFAFMADGGVLQVLQMGLLALWQRFDPEGVAQDLDRPWQLGSPWPTIAIALLGLAYFALFEGFLRRSPGKWLTGQRIVLVDRAGSGVGWRMLRAVIWSAPGLLGQVVGLWAGHVPEWIKAAASGGGVGLLGIVVMLAPMRRRNGWRGLHERLSCTRVVATPLPFEKLVRQAQPPPSHLEPSDSVPLKLGTYTTVGRVGRTPSGTIYEADDKDLERRVWIHAHDRAGASSATSRRAVERPSRLRWLDAFEERGVPHEVFEAPGGAGLPHCARALGGLPWPTTRRALTTLAEELAFAPDLRLSPDQLWIDRNWNLRVLDEPLGEAPASALPAGEIVAAVARSAMPPQAGAGPRLPPDLPVHSEPLARRLFGLDRPFASIAELRDALAATAGRPQGLTWKLRGLGILLSTGLLFMCFTSWALSTYVFVLPALSELIEQHHALEEVLADRELVLADLESSDLQPSGAPLDDASRRVREILASRIDRRMQHGGQGLSIDLDEAQERRLEDLRARHEGVSEGEVAAAAAAVRASRPEGYDPLRAREARIFQRVPFVLPIGLTLLWLLFALPLAFLLRGGASLRLLWIAVRDARGRRAGRWRCAWRAFLCSLPTLVLYALPVPFAIFERFGLAALALAVAVVGHGALIAFALRDPARGPQDRVAGTRLVPL